MVPWDPFWVMKLHIVTTLPTFSGSEIMTDIIPLAFDDTGRKFNHHGNYEEWWDNSTIEAFGQRAQCFVDQFSQFTVPGPDDQPLHVNGSFSLGENIADTNGVITSFSAWKDHEAQSPSQMLPGLQDFTKEQLFFLNYAGTWCEKLRKEYQISWIYNNPHSPGFARILVSKLRFIPHCNFAHTVL